MQSPTRPWTQRSLMQRRSRAAEVRLGQAAEKDILRRWAQATKLPENYRVIGSRDFQDWDFLILDQRGFPYTYLEIKARRIPLARPPPAPPPPPTARAAAPPRDRGGAPPPPPAADPRPREASASAEPTVG